MSFDKVKEEIYNAGKIVSENANQVTSIANAKIRLKKKMIC